MLFSTSRLAATALAASALSLASAQSPITNSSYAATSYGPDYYQPTLKLWLDSQATSGLKSIAYPIAVGYLNNVSGIPDQTFSASGIDLTLTNIKLVNFSLPQQDFNISFAQPNVIVINASGISVTADADYSAQASVLSALSGTASATLSNLVVSAAAGLGTDGYGHPTVQILNTGVTIGDIAVSLGGASSGLLNALLPVAESQIRNTLSSTLNTQVQQIVNSTVAPLVQRLPLALPLSFLNNNTEVYYGLVDEANPTTNTSAIDITTSFARIATAAQVQPIQYPGISSQTVAHHTIPETRPSYNFANSSYPALAVGIDEYFVNSALYTLAVNNVSYTVTNASLPSSYSSYLSTSTLNFIYPTLASQYPNEPLIAKVRPAVVQTAAGPTFPTLTVNHTGNHTVYAPLYVELSVNNNGVPTPLAEILVTLNATIEFGLQPYNNTQKVVGNATSLTIDIETISQQYNFNPPLSSFASLANQLAGGSLLNTANGLLAQGYVLPSLPYAKLQNAQFQSIDHVLYFLTNVVSQ